MVEHDENHITDTNFRYERKFVVPPTISVMELVALVKSNSYFFVEAYHERQVNNIYLGTPDYKFFFDNVDGVAKRQKVRIRWYGESQGFIENARLEVKLKDGLIGDKWVFSLTPFRFDKNFSAQDLKNLLQSSGLPKSIFALTHNLTPTSINSYSRRYFLSADRRFRITLDYDIVYKNAKRIDLIDTQILRDFNKIVELKYAVKNDLEVGRIATQFPFSLSKNSKYVNGIKSFQNFPE